MICLGRESWGLFFVCCLYSVDVKNLQYNNKMICFGTRRMARVSVGPGTNDPFSGAKQIYTPTRMQAGVDIFRRWGSRCVPLSRWSV
jgi:hypothetical protein